MRRLARSFVAFTLVVAVPGFVSAALAHGGSYRGPAGEIPPDSREPSDPPPPPQGGGPQTPGGGDPSGPSTPGGPDAGPATPGSGGGSGGGAPPTSGPGGGGPDGGGSPSTSNGGRAPGASKAVGFGGWAFWWGHNKDEILQLKSAVNRMNAGVRSGNSFGRRDPNALLNVTDAAIRARIVPALRTLLADETQSFHIRSAAELGLAKIGDRTVVGTLRQMARNEAKSFHREIEETAALALGLMQDDDLETKRFLVDIVREQAKDGTFVRPFSAISLGFLGERNDREHAVMSALVEVIARKEPGADVKPSCLTALGLLGSDAAVPELLSMVRSGKASPKGAVALTEVETAYAVAALGKIGSPGLPGDETAVLDEIVRIVEKEKSNWGTNVRRSAVIAIGQIGPQCPAKVQRRGIEMLKRLAEDARDEQERCFALMSLGRIGAAKNVESATRKDVVAALGRVMDKGSGQSPAFAAMALGLVGRAIDDEGGAAPEEEIRAPLRAKFAAGGQGQLRGAFALASGLVRDPLAVGRLLDALKDRSEDKRVRGWCSLALGMIGARESADVIRATLKDDADRDLRVHSAMAAGLLNDSRVVEDVVAVIRDREASNYELGSAALALGQIGDEHAIDALLAVAVDKESLYPDLTRSLAVVALGQIGDRRDVPVLARLSTDVNYRAHVPAITEMLTIL